MSNETEAAENAPMTEGRLIAIEQYAHGGEVTKRGVLALIAEIRRLQAELNTVEQSAEDRGYQRGLRA